MSLNLITLTIRRAGGGAPMGFPSVSEPLAILSGAVWVSTTEGRPDWDNTYAPQNIKFAQMATYVTGGYTYVRTSFAGQLKPLPDATINQFNTDWILRLNASATEEHSANRSPLVMRFYDSSNDVQFYLEVYHPGNWDNWIRYGVTSGTTIAPFVSVALQVRGQLTFTDTEVTWTADADIPADRQGAGSFTQACDLTDIVRVEVTGAAVINYVGTTGKQTLSLDLIGGTIV